VAGREATLLRLPEVAVAAPVCFEISYPDLLRGFAAAGAELVVNLSNDAWFGRTGFAETHLAHAPFRAVELRRWVVRGTNTGISAFVDPGGRVMSRLGLFEEGVLRGRVQPSSEPTLYARHGDAPWLALLAGCAGVPLLYGAGRSPRS
jgi:apolipoprotein N-acyltransferase